MTEGETSFLVLEPLEADDYTCRINPLGRAMQCLYANDSLFEKATVKVDTVEVRLMLLETETNETKEITDEQDHRIHEAVEERSKLETAMKKENTQMQKMMSKSAHLSVDTGKRQQVSECWTSNMNTKQMGNCQAVLALTAGQKVYLENAGGNRVFFEPMSTTFGGVLMKVDMSSKL
ncbi:hypothetical protein BaRGS_00038198 [Batillaria attramentaria]|uniref:Uncharacterized protein n=1 Tax=Batillaria attramentaria TaxID=370345 RepID=A0ABD0J719_9CAEN